MSKIESLLESPEHERKAKNFISELDNVSEQYPELDILGILDTDMADVLNEKFVSERETGQYKKAKKNWKLSQAIDVSSVDKNVVYVYIRGDSAIAGAAREKIDNLAVQNGAEEPDVLEFDPVSIEHFLHYAFKS